MKYVLTLLLLIPFVAGAQSPRRVLYGASRPQDTNFSVGQTKWPAYSTSDSNKVLGIGSDGTITLRTKNTGGSTTASAVPKLLKAGEVHSSTQYPGFPVYVLSGTTHHGWYKEGATHADPGKIVYMSSTDGSTWAKDTVVASGVTGYAAGIGNNGRLLVITNGLLSTTFTVRYKDVGATSWTTAPVQAQNSFIGQSIQWFSKIRQVNGDTLIGNLYSYGNKTSAQLSYDNGLTWRPSYIDTTKNRNETEFLPIGRGDTILYVSRPLEPASGGNLTIPRIGVSVNKGITFTETGGFGARLAAVTGFNTYPGALSYYKGKVWATFGYRSGTGSCRFFDMPVAAFWDSTLIPLAKSFGRSQTVGLDQLSSYGYFSTDVDTVNGRLQALYYDYSTTRLGASQYTAIYATPIDNHYTGTFTTGVISVTPASTYYRKSWSMQEDGFGFTDKDTSGAISIPEPGLYNVSVFLTWSVSTSGTGRWAALYNESRLTLAGTNSTAYNSVFLGALRTEPTAEELHRYNSFSFTARFEQGRFLVLRTNHDALTSTNFIATVTISKIGE